jgi:hypothetical protein
MEPPRSAFGRGWTGRFPDEWRSKQTFKLPRRSGPLRNGQARVMTRRATHHSLECKTERALRFVPQRAGDGANGNISTLLEGLRNVGLPEN